MAGCELSAFCNASSILKGITTSSFGYMRLSPSIFLFRYFSSKILDSSSACNCALWFIFAKSKLVFDSLYSNLVPYPPLNFIAIFLKIFL